jgi:hypothetical protein
MALQTRDYAWLAIGAYDLLAPPGQTLSEGFDDYQSRRRVVSTAIATVVFLHVVNVIPPQLDPIHLAFIGLKRAAHLARATTVLRSAHG